MIEKKIDEVLDLAENIAIMRLRLIGNFYIPYLSWGIYTLLGGIIQLFGYYQQWALLWLPAAFFSSLDPDFKNLRTSIISWAISGVIYYALILGFGAIGFFVGLAVAPILGYGILPFLIDKNKEKPTKSYLVNSIGTTFFVIILAFVSQIFVYKLWENPQLFSYHFTIMVGIFYGINASFTKSKVLFRWFLILVIGAAVSRMLHLSWIVPVLGLSVSAIYVGIYGIYLRKKINWEVS